MLKRFSLKAKLLILFLLVGVVPFSTAALLALWKSSAALERQAYNQLVSVRDIKRAQITKFFEEREGDMGVLMETVASLQEEAFGKLSAVQQIKKSQIEGFFHGVYADVESLATSADVARAFATITEYRDAVKARPDGPLDVSTEDYRRRYDLVDDYLGEFMRQNGYYDVFLICAKHGHVMFSGAKESDLGQNVSAGSLRNEGLGRLWRQVVQTGKTAIVDFAPYSPSNGQQASFVGAPVRGESGELIAVVALQVPTDPINAVAQKRDGMGASGESYLVGEFDGTIAFRSDMKTMGDGKYVIGYPIDTPYIRKAIGGHSANEVYTDSSGNLVMVSYDPLKIDGLQWAMVSKINLQEVIAPKLKGETKDFYAKYIEKYGYYDLFLIHPQGQCFYTVCREADYNTNLVDGKFADSGLGKLTRRVLETKQFGLADFEPYEPSNGDPAAFIAQPIIHHGEVELIVALQLSLEAINEIMTQRDGMGETGETYLVGSDLRMRSDSFLDPEGHSVLASFHGTVEQNGVPTEAARQSTAGHTDAKIITDYNGNPVLSAYGPVTVGETTWGLLAEMDQSEAFEAVAAMKWMMGITAIVGIAAIVTVALLVASSISTPINRIIEGLTAGAQQTAEAAGQVSGASQSLAEGASEQAAGIEETTSSVEEMTSMTKSNAENANQADGLMEQASKVVSGGLESMNRLNDAVGRIRKSSEETAKIIKTIDEIAFQTNLLALNAAVEAARAGEAGKGFAVVAEEVRSLAQRAAEAARTTADLIEESVRNAEDGVNVAGESAKAFEEISESSSKVSQLVSEIASASQQQADGIEQINQAVTQMDQVTQTNAANAEESASAAEELSSQAEELQHMVNQLEALVSGATSEPATGAAEFRAQPSNATRQGGASRGASSQKQPPATASAQHRPQPAQATQPAGHYADSDGDDGMTQF